MSLVKVVEVGDELGIELPEQLLASWKLQLGDTIDAALEPDGILLKPPADKPGVNTERG